MKHDAEIHAEEDKKKREMVDIRNIADQMIYTAEKALLDAGDKITTEIKTGVEEKVKSLKEVKDKDDVEAIKNATSALSTEMQKIGETLNKQNETPNTETKPEDNVRDAEVSPEENNPDTK